MGSRRMALKDEELYQLQECLLLGYRLDAGAGTFAVTCEHWEKPGQGQRAFLKLLFRGVERFEREAGHMPSLRSYTTEYRLRGASATTVFQAIELARDGASKRAAFWFGPGYGGCSFSYEDVHAFVRVARVENRGNEWEYRDIENNDVMDFYEPFETSAAEG